MAVTTPEAALDRLIAAGVVIEHDDGTITTDPAFEDARRVYADTYGDCTDEVFQQTIADLFGLEPAAAADRIEETGVTRDELVAFLTLQSVLEASPDTEVLATMSRVVVAVEPSSPVPRSLRTLGDDEYESFLETHPNALLTVWKQGCAPCDAMKADLDAIVAAVPDEVAIAGVDGDAVPQFRRAFDVTAAPSVVVISDGAHAETASGRQSPAAVEKLIADHL